MVSRLVQAWRSWGRRDAKLRLNMRKGWSWLAGLQNVWQHSGMCMQRVFIWRGMIAPGPQQGSVCCQADLSYKKETWSQLNKYRLQEAMCLVDASNLFATEPRA